MTDRSTARSRCWKLAPRPSLHDNKNFAGAYAAFLPSAGISTKASKYAAAPHASVAVRPN